MEWFADVQCGSTTSGNVAGAPFTVRAAFAGSRLRFAGRGIEDSWYRSEQQRWKKSRVNGRRPCVCLNDREGSCVMGFVPIGIDEFIKLHRKSNPGERPDEFIRLLQRSVADARQGARCHCGAPIWAIGSAVVGNACFTCITGEADPSSDYEIDEVLRTRR